MPKLVTPQSSQVGVAKRMRAEGATVGKIARRLDLSLEEANRLVWGDDYRQKLRAFPSGKPIPSIQAAQRKPTPQAFVRWLQIEVNPRLEKLNEWPMGVTQYTYFYSEACWDLRVVATVEINESEHAHAHKNGDRGSNF